MNVKVGDRAPDFVLASPDAEPVRLSGYLGKSIVVLCFYGRDENPVSVLQARSFRETYDVFREGGAEIIGISADTLPTHRRFIEEHRLPFLLLSDEDNIARNLYGVPSFLGIFPGRVTLVVDKKGIVRHIVSSLFNAKKHVEEAFHAVEYIKKE